jgi:ATP-dependent RNA helicase RhlE
VINYEMPNVPETYVHRIGRTGRAGMSGIALSFCDAEEKEYLRDIQKLIGKSVPVVNDHPYPMIPGKTVQPSSAPKQHSRPKNNTQKKSYSSNSGGGSSYGGKRRWTNNRQANSNY